jgi:hypothetical protein
MPKLPLALLAVAALALPGRAADDVKPLKPLNLPLGVNSKDDEDEPHVSSNGLHLYYWSKVKTKDGMKEAIILSTRRSTSAKWGDGKVFEDFFAFESNVRGVYVTAEGVYPQILYFGVFAVDKEEKDKGNWDISFAVRDLAGKGFGPTRPLVTVDSPVDEAHPWLTPGARELYFSRKTGDGWRVFVARRTNTEKIPTFDDPQLIKELPPNFHHATLTPDGKTMYLQGPLDKDRWGLFVSTKTDKGWSKPEELDLLNDPKGKTGDRSPNLSRDGALLYFASDRPGGQGGLDIWVIPARELVKKK